MTEFTAYSIEKNFSIKRETVRDWMDRGFIKPSRTSEDNRGTKRFFDLWEMHCILLFKKIISLGISRETASIMVDSIRPMHPDKSDDIFRHRDTVVFINSKNEGVLAEFKRANDDSTLKSLFTEHESVGAIFCFNFKKIREEVELVGE
jgi:hypothetical protein